MHTQYNTTHDTINMFMLPTSNNNMYNIIYNTLTHTIVYGNI